MAFLVAGCLLLGACGGSGSESPLRDLAARADVKATPFLRGFSKPDPSATELRVTVIGSHCMGEGSSFDHVDVSETDESVTVTVFLHVSEPEVIRREKPRPFWRRNEPTRFCSASGILVDVPPVRLSRPLGLREVHDGACTPPVPVSLESQCGSQYSVPPEPEDPKLGHWTAVDPGPLATRSEPKTVWTGTEVIVVGGLLSDQYQALSDGAAFDPATGRWRRIANRPAPGRVLHAVWTGTELFTFGSDGLGLDTLTTAFAYNPSTDRWRRVPLPPSAKVPHAVVWTGRRVLAWQPGLAAPGALYDPATGRWSPMPANSVPGAVSAGAAVWTGRELAVEGAITPEGGGPAEPRLFLFDPEDHAWRASSKLPTELSTWPFLVAGSAGGQVVITGMPPTGPNPSPGGESAKATTLIYDPVGDTWRQVQGPSDQGRPGFLADEVTAFDAPTGPILVKGTGPLHLLDVGTGSWSGSGPPPGPPAWGTVISTGKGVFTFGITRNDVYVRPREPNGAYLWTP